MATIAAFIAHPDDEVLHMAGTLAQAAAEGHRVVIVCATYGPTDPSSGEPPRASELRASAAVLGAARVEFLPYADSGHSKELDADPARFMRVPMDEASERLAAILRTEEPDVLLIHDANGGYGHREHLRAHEVGRLAAELAGVPRVLEATMPQEFVVRLVRWARRLRLPVRYDPETLRTLYSPRTSITHAVDVRRWARVKRAALAAHGSQLTGKGRSAQVFRMLVRLPVPIFGLLLGREWFVETGVPEAGQGGVRRRILEP